MEGPSVTNARSIASLHSDSVQPTQAPTSVFASFTFNFDHISYRMNHERKTMNAHKTMLLRLTAPSPSPLPPQRPLSLPPPPPS